MSLTTSAWQKIVEMFALVLAMLTPTPGLLGTEPSFDGISIADAAWAAADCSAAAGAATTLEPDAFTTGGEAAVCGVEAWLPYTVWMAACSRDPSRLYGSHSAPRYNVGTSKMCTHFEAAASGVRAWLSPPRLTYTQRHKQTDRQISKQRTRPFHHGLDRCA